MKNLKISYWIDKYRRKGPRSKSVMVGSFSLVISQVVNVFAGFLITGMLTRYLLPDEFGLWTLIMSLTGIFGGIDFGFANALRNKISKLYVDKEKNDGLIKGYYFSIFYTFVLWALFITILLIVIKPFVEWSVLFNTTKASIIRDGSVLFVLGASVFSFNLAFSISTVGFFSYQESHWNAVIGIIFKVFLLAVTFILIKYHSTFIVLNSAFLFVTVISGVISFTFFNIKRKWRLILLQSKIVVRSVRELFGKSMQFIILQIAAIIYAQIDLFIISKILGLESVGEFSLIKKLFLVFSGFHFSFLMPIWSAYTEAVESKDFLWVEKAVTKFALYAVVAFAFLMVFLAVFGPFIIRIWTGKTIDSRILYLLLGIFYILTAWNNSFSVFLNSNNLLKKQIMLLSLSSFMLIILLLVLGRNYGLNGVCVGLILSSLPLAISNPIQSYNFIRKRAYGASHE